MTPIRQLYSPKVPFGTEDIEDLYEHAPCGYLSLEPDGRIDRVNATFLAWTGHGPEELLGRNFQNLLSIAGKIFYETHFVPMLRMQGFFNEVALDLIAKDGTPIPVLVNAIERRDPTGKATFIRITVFNATDRRRYERELLDARNALATANEELGDLNTRLEAANEQLERTNRELRTFYEALPVGIFRADASGRVVQASRRFCALFGIDVAEHWLTAIADHDRSATKDQLHRAIRDGNPFSLRIRISPADAAARHLDMKAVPIVGPGDETLTLVGVVEDVTEQMRAEAQSRQIDRDAVVSQLTGGLAHNLNNILVVVLGKLEILENKLADRPELLPALNAGIAAAERAAVLVSRLLVYSGHSTSRPDRVEIDPCLDRIAEEFAGRFGQHHKLTCDLRAPGSFVELETGMLREAVGEMLSNAVAAMPAGGEIRLTTRACQRDTTNGRPIIILAVNDQGIGMNDDTLAKAREPFFTMREVGQGIGLGLSLVEGIARIAGGELRLQSQVGSGTTVELHLPVAFGAGPTR